MHGLIHLVPHDNIVSLAAYQRVILKARRRENHLADCLVCSILWILRKAREKKN
jgi:hypothetical protein